MERRTRRAWSADPARDFIDAPRRWDDPSKGGATSLGDIPIGTSERKLAGFPSRAPRFRQRWQVFRRMRKSGCESGTFSAECAVILHTGRKTCQNRHPICTLGGKCATQAPRLAHSAGNMPETPDRRRTRRKSCQQKAANLGRTRMRSCSATSIAPGYGRTTATRAPRTMSPRPSR